MNRMPINFTRAFALALTFVSAFAIAAATAFLPSQARAGTGWTKDAIKLEVLEQLANDLTVTTVQSVCGTGKSGYVVEVKKRNSIDPRTGQVVPALKTVKVYGVIRDLLSNHVFECAL